MTIRQKMKEVENLRKAIMKVRKWWKSGPSVTGLFGEVWAAAKFDLEETQDNKANRPYDAKDHRGRKIGIKARCQTPYTKQTRRGLNYFAFHQRELDECDTFYLVAFDDKLIAKLCLRAPKHIVKNHVKGGTQKRLTFTTGGEFGEFLAQKGVRGKLIGSKDSVRWRNFGLGLD